MLIIPAIDLKEGQCVRLRQGRMDEVTTYSDDPKQMAGHWIESGAKRLHLVDLDGAIAGEPKHQHVVEAIVTAYPDCPVQIGGGIRSEAQVETYLNAGAAFVIIGTWALKEPQVVARLCGAYPNQIIIGIDAKDGQVAVEGWESVSETSALTLAKEFQTAGAAAIVYTDISRDGMLSGCNIEATAELAKDTGIPVIASGGVKDIDDIHGLLAVADAGISGVIVGRSIYDGTLSFADAVLLTEAQA